jgi:O-antigen/teichoic acid export membrane protein
MLRRNDPAMSVQRNTAFNLIGAAVPMLLMLLTVPLYLRCLGEARYGLMALVWLLLGYFSFLELGLGKAASNQMAGADYTPNRGAGIFWTALAVNASMGVLGAAALYVAEPLLLPLVVPPSSNAALREEVASAYPWLVATFPIALASSVLQGSLEGRSRFFELNLIQITTSILFQLTPLAVAYWIQPSLALTIPAAVVSRGLMSLLTLATCRYLLPLRGIPRFSMPLAKQLFNYGSWIAISAIAVPLLETLERFVVSAVLGLIAVTQYTVPMQLVAKLKVFPASLARALFPTFSASTR